MAKRPGKRPSKKKRAPKKTATTKELLKAARASDLQLSGLNSKSIITKLKLTTLLDAEQTRELTGISDAVSYEIPYFDLKGRATNFSRWKLIPLKDPLPFKYYQAPKTVPRLYLPPLVNWTRLASDVSQRLILTEGEKKSATACLHGMPCIGLGGVWSWKAKKWGQDVLRDFDQFEWEGREVEICYDGDLYSNANVARAMGALCLAMSERGARVFMRILPNTDGRSSLDEFLVEHGVEADASGSARRWASA